MPERDIDVLALGEVMLRFSPPGFVPLEDTPLLEFRTGGAEANVAVALARLGMRTSWAGALPEGPLGRAAARRLRGFGVDLSAVVWVPNARMGLYFIEPAVPPRTARVLYDRAGSAAAGMRPEHFDWSVLDRCRAVHLTGITPALSASAAETALACAREARGRGCRLSFDVNYRSRLWSPSAARDGLLPFLELADLVVCPGADAEAVFGCGGGPDERLRGLGGLTPAPLLALTCGSEGAVLWDRSTFHHGQAYPVQVVDRVGAGDAFDAGLIRGWLRGDPVEGLRWGMAMAALKHTIPGDDLLVTRDDVEALLRDGCRDIQR